MPSQELTVLNDSRRFKPATVLKALTRFTYQLPGQNGHCDAILEATVGVLKNFAVQRGRWKPLD